MKDTKLDKAFGYSIGCLGLVGVAATVMTLLVAITRPTQVITILERIAGLTPTPILTTVTPWDVSTRVPAELPTYTPLPTYMPYPTPTIPPQASVTPTVVLPLPFQDTFDSGYDRHWQIISGNWLTVDGELTIAGSDTAWIRVGDQSWTDYAVEVDVSHMYFGSANTGTFAVAVRIAPQKSNLIAFQCNSIYRCEWVLLEGTTETSLAPRTCCDLASARYRIEVIGETYTAYRNGQQIQSITYPGFNRGLVGLAIDDCNGGCISFDNLTVAPLP